LEFILQLSVKLDVAGCMLLAAGFMLFAS
jgi:hypothetical protein